MCLSDYVADPPDSPVLLNSLSLLQAKKVPAGPLTKENRKKLRYFLFPPDLAHRKLIDLANYLPSSSSRGVWASRNDFFKSGKNGGLVGKDFVAGFAKNESLHRRISTKYKSSKLFWRILEDNKQNKRENWGKRTVRVFTSNSPSLAHILLKRSEIRPAGLFAFKALLKRLSKVNIGPRGDAKISSFPMLISSGLSCIIR